MREAALITPELLERMRLQFGSDVHITQFRPARPLISGDVVLFGPNILTEYDDGNMCIGDNVDAPVDFITGADAEAFYTMIKRVFIPTKYIGRNDEAANQAWASRSGENNDEDGRGMMMRVLGARTRFFLAPDGSTREVGIITPNFLTMLLPQTFTEAAPWTRNTLHPGDLFEFERTFLNEPFDDGFDPMFPERVTRLAPSTFATYLPLQVAKHRVVWNSAGVGHITSPWMTDDADPEADVLFEKYTHTECIH